MNSRSGSILVGVLWALAILSMVVVSVLHTSSIDLRVVKNQGDRIQARYLALAGVEKTKAMLYHDAYNRQQTGQNHTGYLYDNPEVFQEIEFGRGTYSVFKAPQANQVGGVIFGVRDEESRLNVNAAELDELRKLPNISIQAAGGVIDYRDGDSVVSEGGAEIENYAALVPPRLPRNGDIPTLRELLMVLGPQPTFMLGEDTNLNLILDPNENDGDATMPLDDMDSQLDTGWIHFLTTYSGIDNVNARGLDRINAQSAEAEELITVEGITQNIADAIVDYRDDNEFESLADLLDVRQTGRGGGGGRGGDEDDEDDDGPTGPALINQQLLQQIADSLAVGDDTERNGVVNINTAPYEVLFCLPGMDEIKATAIINYRSSAGYFNSVADLLNVQGIDRETFSELGSRICARSQTFRILCEGSVPSTGARRRIETVVRLTANDVITLDYREDDLQ